MSVEVRTPPRMSLEEFLVWPGDGRAKRYQLVDGEARPMPVTDAAHGVIHANVGCAIVEGIAKSGVPLRGVMLAGIVPGTRPDMNFRVADLAVTSAPDVAGQIAVRGAVLAAEILSPGNERDTREAVRAYTTVASMQEILVVSSTRIAAEILRRQADEHWPKVPEEVGPGGTVRLDSVGLTCPIEEFYVGTHLVS